MGNRGPHHLRADTDAPSHSRVTRARARRRAGYPPLRTMRRARSWTSAPANRRRRDEVFYDHRSEKDLFWKSRRDVVGEPGSRFGQPLPLVTTRAISNDRAVDQAFAYRSARREPTLAVARGLHIDGPTRVSRGARERAVSHRRTLRGWWSSGGRGDEFQRHRSRSSAQSGRRDPGRAPRIAITKQAMKNRDTLSQFLGEGQG